MNNRFLSIILLTFISVMVFYDNIHTQGFGIGYSPSYHGGYPTDPAKLIPKKDPFMEKISLRFGENITILNSLRKKGYGRLELIKLLLPGISNDESRFILGHLPVGFVYIVTVGIDVEIGFHSLARVPDQHLPLLFGCDGLLREGPEVPFVINVAG